MKVSINIPGRGQIYVSGSAEVINRKALCRELGINNTALCRLEALHGFEYALGMLLSKKRKLL